MRFQGSVQQQSWLPVILTQQKKHVIYSSEKWMHNKMQHNKSLSARITTTASRQTMVIYTVLVSSKKLFWFYTKVLEVHLGGTIANLLLTLKFIFFVDAN